MLSIVSMTSKPVAMAISLLMLVNSSIAEPDIRRGRNTGTIHFQSNCPYPVWFQIVDQAGLEGGNSPWSLMKDAQGHNAGHTFLFSKFAPISATDADGISIKFGRQDYTNQTPGPITQVELAWTAAAAESVDYDTSDLNAYGPSPFYEQGYVLWADTAPSIEYPLCNTLHCGAGESPCTDSYWYDEPVNPITGESVVNHVMTCPDTTNLVFEICSG